MGSETIEEASAKMPVHRSPGGWGTTSAFLPLTATEVERLIEGLRSATQGESLFSQRGDIAIHQTQPLLARAVMFAAEIVEGHDPTLAEELRCAAAFLVADLDDAYPTGRSIED